MSGCGGGCGHCGGKCKKDQKDWTPIRYYIMYTVSVFNWHMRWESVRKVELLENAVDGEKAKIEAGKWLRKMRKKGDLNLKLKSARLVASTHKDILKLT